MEPINRNDVAKANPNASPADIAEYERMLAERFATDPDSLRDPMMANSVKAREQRLQELYERIFKPHRL